MIPTHYSWRGDSAKQRTVIMYYFETMCLPLTSSSYFCAECSKPQYVEQLINYTNNILRLIVSFAITILLSLRSSGTFQGTWILPFFKIKNTRSVIFGQFLIEYQRENFRNIPNQWLNPTFSVTCLSTIEKTHPQKLVFSFSIV